MTDPLLQSLAKHHASTAYWPHAPYWFCMADEPRATTIADIKAAVVRRFGVERSNLNSARRGKGAVARQVAMYLAYKLTEHSHPTIGRSFKKSDHTSSLRASKLIPARMLADAELAATVNELEALFA